MFTGGLPSEHLPRFISSSTRPEFCAGTDSGPAGEEPEVSALGKHTGGRGLTKRPPARFTNQHFFQPLLAHRDEERWKNRVIWRFAPPGAQTYILLLRAPTGRLWCGTGEQSRTRATHHCCRTLREHGIVELLQRDTQTHEAPGDTSGTVRLQKPGQPPPTGPGPAHGKLTFQQLRKKWIIHFSNFPVGLSTQSR